MYRLGLLLRNLRPSVVFRDLTVLSAAGTLAAFAVLFVTRTVFDQVTYEVGLNYRAVAGATVPAELQVALYRGVEVYPTHPLSGGSGKGDYIRAVQAYAHTFPGESLAAAQQLYDGVITSGTVRRDSVVLDAATAWQFGVRVGDRIVVSHDTPDGSHRENVVQVSGIQRSSHELESSGSQGSLLMSSDLSRSLVSGHGPDQVVSYNPVPSAGDSKWQAISRLITHDRQATGFVISMAVCALAFWMFTIYRVNGEIRLILMPAARIMVALGVSPRGISRTLLAVPATLLIAASLVAGLVSRRLLAEWGGVYSQVSQLGSTVFIMGVSGMVVVSLIAARPLLGESW